MNVSAGGFSKPSISQFGAPPCASYHRLAPAYPVRTTSEMLPAPQPNRKCFRSCFHAHIGASMWKMRALIEKSPDNSPSVTSAFNRGWNSAAPTPAAVTAPTPPTNPMVAAFERKFTVAASHASSATIESNTMRVPEPIAIEPTANTGISQPIRRSRVIQYTGSSTPYRCMPM